MFNDSIDGTFHQKGHIVVLIFSHELSEANIFIIQNSSANVYMNKKLWNTVILDSSIPQVEIERMMDNSFQLVVSKMTKKDQQSILTHL